jgi:hypothetical protein
MASTINTSHNKCLFWLRRYKISDTLVINNDTLTIDDDTLEVSGRQ